MRWLVLVGLVACGGDRITNVYEAPSSGSGGAGVGGAAASTAASGEAGSGSAGGGGEGSAGGTGGGVGGAGGGACVPSQCQDIHGACGPTDDGCGATVDCPVSDCGYTPTDQWPSCGEAGLCICNQASGISLAQYHCANDDAAKAWCDATGGCDAFFCGESPKPMAPTSCMSLGHVDGVSPELWCCFQETP